MKIINRQTLRDGEKFPVNGRTHRDEPSPIVVVADDADTQGRLFRHEYVWRIQDALLFSSYCCFRWRNKDYSDRARGPSKCMHTPSVSGRPFEICILFYFCARREEWRTGKGRDPRQTGDEILFSYSYSSGATSQLGYVQTPRAATCYVIFLRPATNKLTVATQMHPSRGCKKREKEKVALFIFPSSLLKEKRSREMDTLVSLALTRCPRPLLYTSTSIPSDEALVLLLLLFIVHLLMPL